MSTKPSTPEIAPKRKRKSPKASRVQRVATEPHEPGKRQSADKLCVSGHESPDAPRIRERSLDPVVIGRTVASLVYRHATAHSANRLICRQIAQAVASDVAQAWASLVRRHLGIDDSQPVCWHQIGMNDGIQHPHDGIMPASASPPASPGITSATSVPQAERAPGDARPDDGIGRAEVLGLLRTLLTRASDGEVGVGDSVRLAEAIARLEGMAQATKPDLRVYLVQFGAPELASIPGSAP